MMKVGEIMTREVISLKPDMTLKEAAEIFAKNKYIFQWNFCT